MGEIDNLDDNNDIGETWSIEWDIKEHMQLTVWMNFYHINEIFWKDEAKLVNKIDQTYIIGCLAEIQLHGWGNFHTRM